VTVGLSKQIASRRSEQGDKVGDAAMPMMHQRRTIRPMNRSSRVLRPFYKHNAPASGFLIAKTAAKKRLGAERTSLTRPRVHFLADSSHPHRNKAYPHRRLGSFHLKPQPTPHRRLSTSAPRYQLSSLGSSKLLSLLQFVEMVYSNHHPRHSHSIPKPSSIPTRSAVLHSANQNSSREPDPARAEANWVAFPPLPEAALHSFSSAVQFVSTTLKPLTEPRLPIHPAPCPTTSQGQTISYHHHHRGSTASQLLMVLHH
ncbi:hypothetical protein KEM48_008863, partial [Puccinia striiformis f. sp. tritici PST-130]